MTSSLRWDAHFTHLISRGHWFFAQRTSRDHSEGFSATPTHFLLTTCVVPSTISSTEFIGDCNGKSRADGLRTTTMGCRLSRWASRTPSVSAVDEFALVDSFRVSSARLPLCSADSTRSFQEFVFQSPPQSSLSQSKHQAHGSIGVYLFSSTCGPWSVWCWSALFSVVGCSGWEFRFVVCGAVSHPSFTSVSLRELCVARSIYNASIDLGMVRWSDLPDMATTRPSRRPHSLFVVLLRLCRFTSPVISSSPRGTSGSFFI